LEQSKGVFVLFEGFRELVSKYENVELVYFGQGDAQKDLFLMVQQSGWGAKVKMAGHHFGEISEVMLSIDIYVSPSFWEGLPYSLVEAMRSGLAIVATNVGGTEEALKDSISALIIHPNSSKSLVDALTRIIVSPEMLAELGNAARKSYLEKFQFFDFEQRVQKLFKN
jgi:glycosyltransferase involved in cell wall biosynthesis